jgi:transposase
MTKSTTMPPARTIGIDLGDRRSHVHVLDTASGEVVERFTMPTTPEGVSQRFCVLPRARVVLEAGPHSPWVSRSLEGLGHEVVVANPRKVRLIGGTKKTDRIDAEKTARLGRIDVGLLYPIEHRSEQAQLDLGVVRARDQAVQARTALINHVRGAAKAMGLRLPGCDAHSFSRRMLGTLPRPLVRSLLPLVRLVERTTRTIERYDREVSRLSRTRYPQTQRLRQVDGVGPLTALTFVLVVGSPNRFPRTRRVGAYLGLCPRVEQSGNRDPELPMSKEGDPLLRRLLIQCAHHIVGPFGKDSTLRRLGLRKASAGGRWAKKRAIGMVARRLSVLLLSLWRSGEPYVALRGAPAIPPAPNAKA